MVERSLVLNDGTTINDGEAGLAGDTLALFFNGYTLLQAAQMMCDTSKTRRIRFCYGSEEDVYEGYTRCTTVSVQSGQVSVLLEKAVSV